ncbi:MAG TPA: hypothetical protein VIV15_16630, partial [Anaerolineales bacterium]
PAERSKKHPQQRLNPKFRYKQALEDNPQAGKPLGEKTEPLFDLIILREETCPTCNLPSIMLIRIMIVF